MIVLKSTIRLLGVLSIATVFWPNVAAACTCSTEPLLRTWPSNDSADVPIDVAPILAGALQVESVQFLDELGDSVEFVSQPVPWSAYCEYTFLELTSTRPLAPNRRYELRAASADPLSGLVAGVHFTTGTQSMGTQDVTPPRANLELLTGFSEGVSCGGASQACVAIDDPGSVELTVRKNGDILMRDVVDSSFPYIVLGTLVPDCFEFRRRTSNGQRSEPFSVCGDALKTLEWRVTDYIGRELFCEEGRFGSRDIPATHVGVEVPSSAASPPQAGSDSISATNRERASTRRSGNCTVAPTATAPSRVPLFGLGWLALVALRRRHRLDAKEQR